MLLGPSVRLRLWPETVLDVAGSCCSADNTLITRRSFAGQHWHSHGYQGDNTGVTTTPGGAQPRVVRSLVYPLGFEQEDDGGLKVVRGAHLYRASVLADELHVLLHHACGVPAECVEAVVEATIRRLDADGDAFLFCSDTGRGNRRH